MTDEWSKPVKLNGGWYADGPDGVCAQVVAASGEFDVTNISGDIATAPRDVVLRLLAAEASDRLGWVWEVVRGTEEDPDHWAARCGSTSWWAIGVTGSLNFEQGLGGYGREEIVAAMHGRFLLEDALREAGR